MLFINQLKSFASCCPSSYDSFRVFRKGQEIEIPQNKLSPAKKRAICFGRFLLTPISVPTQIISKIIKLVAAVFKLVAHTIGLLNIRDKNNLEFQLSGLEFLDSLLDALTSPLTLIAEKCRYFVGIINPELVYVDIQQSDEYKVLNQYISNFQN